MSIPLDRLYTFLQDVVNQDIVIYRWYPHGSKKLTDLQPLRNYGSLELEHSLPSVIAHDQEPINFDQYTDADKLEWKYANIPYVPKLLTIDDRELVKMSVYDILSLACQENRKMLVAHSELNSVEIVNLEGANNNVAPVYYWCHALIARDWYRYAQHDPAIKHKNIKKLFLIYNRAWSGTREYRLKFAEMLVKNGLSELCHMGFNSVDSTKVYQSHQFKNSAFQIESLDLEQYFFKNLTDSTASADYCTEDYQQTQIEVVLETLFDDTRWHLTEKTLRPIACGHPFILAATAGSLKYLRSYGFETFDGLIDETYDSILDPVQRLQAIVNSMKQLMSADQETWHQLQVIAKRNQQRFFSDEFQQQVIDELLTNFNQAILTITPSQDSPGGLSQ
jgi:hypothetical protein